MNNIKYSDFWFERIPSCLYVWGNFYLALKAEIAYYIAEGHKGLVTLWLPEQHCVECGSQLDERYHFRLTFSFGHEDISVTWAAETLDNDTYRVKKDFTWSYEPELGELGELSDEFKSWVEQKEEWESRVAIFAIVIAKYWLKYPPSGHSLIGIDVQRGPWAH